MINIEGFPSKLASFFSFYSFHCQLSGGGRLQLFLPD